MDYECCMDKNVVIVSLSADLDHHMAARLRDEIDGMLDKGVSKLLFDFDRINFMDSSGIGLVMGRYKLMKPLGGELHVTNTSPQICKVMKLAGLDRLAKLDK